MGNDCVGMKVPGVGVDRDRFKPFYDKNGFHTHRNLSDEETVKVSGAVHLHYQFASYEQWEEVYSDLMEDLL